MRILSLVVFFYSLSVIISSFIAARGDTRKISIIILAAAISNFFLNLAFIPKFGMMGAAVASLMSYILEYYLFSREARKMELPMNYMLLLKFLVMGILFSGVVYVLKKIIVANPYVEMIIVISVSLVIYIYLSIKSGALSRNEISIIKEFSQKLISKKNKR